VGFCEKVMWHATTVNELRDRCHALGGRVALVPTMGALHEGHLSLVRTGHEHADHVVASVFVNPTQFGPHEDLDKYPRTPEADLQALTGAGVAGVFVPSVEEVYPPGQPACAVDVPALTSGLEGAQRPGHFPGVCRVVAKLLQMAMPDCAVFGRKDYQQLCVVRAMVSDLAMPIEIIDSPTVREADGLAMSSRNRYLDPARREQAVGLSHALRSAREMVAADRATPVQTLEQRMAAIMTEHGLAVDYAAVRHAQTLAPVTRATAEAVALVAGRLGGVRLLDNMTLA